MMIWTYHGLFFALGAITVAAQLTFYHRRLKLAAATSPVEEVLMVFLSGLLGAKLAYGLFIYSLDWTDYVAFWQVGLVSWGGILLGSLAAMALYRRRSNYQLWVNSLVLALLPGWMIGRVGNLLERDAYGIIDHQWAFFYDRVPVVLFEIVGLIIITIISAVLWQAQLERNDLPTITLGLYSLLRLAIDGWRDLPVVVWQLNISQLTALVVLFYVMITLWKNKTTRAT